ncbi:RsiV family protein [Caulobacter sp. Root487D2Y]|uniref:RsiV family protein n=1 Tax=Caulobacter sp. Root487D2Y TaxID=1736547 RepID=UPI000A4B986B|nr:RsiV family protein [Caulobacter sp. Root487D2Y]
MKPFSIAALALLAALGACDRKPAPPAEAPAAPTAPVAAAPAPTARPLAFDQTDPAAKVALSLPAEIANYPALHALLYDREVASLRTFAAKAETDRKASDGKFPWRPYNRQGQWFLAADAAPLVGLRALWFEDTGGAHPNHGGASLLWDAAANREIQPKALFRPEADMTVLDKAICDAVAQAKTHREGAVPLSDMFSCPKWSQTVLVLAPSAIPGKVGGLTALIDPYVVGPYSEGDYEVTIPVSAFQVLLAPAYAGAFGGAPKSPGAPDGTVSVKMDVK